MAYSYKSSISFGLVYIPITLHASIKRNDINFNFIDKSTMSRIRYKKTCLDCEGREVKNEDIVKGYEFEDDNYVIIDDKDFEKIKSKRDKTITIEKFVNLQIIDPLYFEKTYFVAPTGAEQAYSLLMGAMESKNMAGIAKTVLGTKETLIVLRAKGGQMLLNTLYFEDEIQTSPAKNIKPITSGKELELAKSLIENMSGEFDISIYKDEYRQKLVALIDSKISGTTLALPKEKEQKHIGSLMDALLKSIESSKKTGKVKSVPKTSKEKATAVNQASKSTAENKTATKQTTKPKSEIKTTKQSTKPKAESKTVATKQTPKPKNESKTKTATKRIYKQKENESASARV
ncbi:MAG TPA: Ku protein [Clostridia bacterium]|nr:Ku protein [Clostridia bacterium]